MLVNSQEAKFRLEIVWGKCCNVSAIWVMAEVTAQESTPIDRLLVYSNSILKSDIAMGRPVDTYGLLSNVSLLICVYKLYLSRGKHIINQVLCVHILLTSVLRWDRS